MTYMGLKIEIVENGWTANCPKTDTEYKVTHGNMMNDGNGKIYMTKPDFDMLKKKAYNAATTPNPPYTQP